MKAVVLVTSLLIVVGATPEAVGQNRKKPMKAQSTAEAPVISQERLEGFYLEMPTTYLLPKEIQVLLKSTIQGKSELEDRYSKLYTDKNRLGNLILVQVETLRNATAARLKLDDFNFDREMASLKADHGIENFEEVMDRFAEDKKATETRTYPPGYTVMQVTKLHLELAKLQLVLTYDKTRNITRQDLGSVDIALAYVRDWMKQGFH